MNPQAWNELYREHLLEALENNTTLTAAAKESVRGMLVGMRPAKPGEEGVTFTLQTDRKVRMHYDRVMDMETALRVFDAIRAADPGWLP